MSPQNLDKPQNLVFTLCKELFKIVGTLQKVEGFLFWDVSLSQEPSNLKWNYEYQGASKYKKPNLKKKFFTCK